MNASRIMVCLAVSAALALSACGDDDDENTGGGSTTATTTTQEQTSSAEGAQLEDIEPRSAKPNLAGGDAPIDEFIDKAAQDAMAYWGQVFENSQAEYQQPTVNLASEAGTVCERPFDPAKSPGFFFCADPSGGSELTYGTPFLDQLRGSAGDGAVAFLVGYGAALDANNKLSGNPVGTQQETTDDFLQVAGCFTGAWIRNLNDRQILQEGDEQEILELAGQFLPGADATVGRKAVIFGHDNGAGPCQQEYGGAPSDG